MNAPALTPGQREALAELRQLALAYPDQILELEELPSSFADAASARVRVSTEGIERLADGLPISDSHEDVFVLVGSTYPDEPPLVLVDHDRFLGHVHVLRGRCLCIYLDPSREWHPSFGMTHVLERLWEWLAEGAGNRFDSRTALFHVFGGVPPTTVAGPTVVVRSTPPVDGKKLSLATVRRRTPSRLDIVAWRQGRATPPDFGVVVIGVSQTLPKGLSRSLLEVLPEVAQAGGPQPLAALDAITRAASASPRGEPLFLLVSVRHPAAPHILHLAVGLIAVPVADGIRAGRSPADPALQQIPIEWLPMSDERPEITTRRDSTRPMSTFHGKVVELWGCGGLGSWIAEFVVRGGVKTIVLRDTKAVGGGILARQNYCEDDIGEPKALQLAARLRAIADDVQVLPEPGSALRALESGHLPTCDLVIDATINETVAFRLDQIARKAGTDNTRPLLVQVATDPRAASLGLLVVASPHLGLGPTTIDDHTAERVLQDGALERFHGFWTPADKNEQLVPAAGCSVPTFHGSAADLAVVSGALANLIAQHLESGSSGTHLIAAPTLGDDGPTHVFFPFQGVEAAS